MSRYRDAVLAVAGWPPLERFARARGLRLGAARFVAGETLADALRVADGLERTGRAVIFDRLGEYRDTAEGVAEERRDVEALVDALAQRAGSRALSVKPTQLGLALDPALAHRTVLELAERTAAADATLCLDMENHAHVEGTLRLLEGMHDAGHHHVAGVLQSNLKRTPADLERLLARDPVPELRLVKGAYREAAEVAHTAKRDVDAAYATLLERLFEGGGRVDVATHDEAMIDRARQLAARHAPPGGWEVQLLHGVRPKLQERLVAEGVPIRVYLPYGADWYGYFTRRLAERPANLGFLVRGLFG